MLEPLQGHNVLTMERSLVFSYSAFGLCVFCDTESQPGEGDGGRRGDGDHATLPTTERSLLVSIPATQRVSRTMRS